MAQQRWGGFLYRDDCDDLFVDVEDLAHRWTPDPAKEPAVLAYLREQADRFPSNQPGGWLRQPDPFTALDHTRRGLALVESAMRIVTTEGAPVTAMSTPINLSSDESPHLRVVLHNLRLAMSRTEDMLADETQ